MPTYLHDFANNTLLYNASGTPAAKTATITGTGVDMLNGDFQCFAFQDIGTVSGTNPTWDGKIQESDALATGYTDIAGAVFPQVTASTRLEIINFLRTKRYLRYVGTIGGTDTPTFGVAAYIGEQKKVV